MVLLRVPSGSKVLPVTKTAPPSMACLRIAVASLPAGRVSQM
jgi:hypothetical protein